MPSKPFSDALKEKDRQKGIQSCAGGRRRGKPLLQVPDYLNIYLIDWFFG